MSDTVPLASNDGLIIGLRLRPACSDAENTAWLSTGDGDGGVGPAPPSDVLAADEVGVLLAVGRPPVQRVIQEYRTVSQRQPLDVLQQYPGIAPRGGTSTVPAV
ncbi:hypothetical protein [Streptomyces sp. NBC_00658]|uniref:hypothetical protein n=1 Tax=Streptomyces sp. NBC_00658 TaxID=2975800 RepID=UPI003252895A